MFNLLFLKKKKKKYNLLRPYFILFFLNLILFKYNYIFMQLIIFKIK